MRELASGDLGISIDWVHFILRHGLHMKKLSARWVPHLLTLEQIRNRLGTSAECF